MGTFIARKAGHLFLGDPIRLGYQRLRSKHVPFSSKAVALAIGFGVTIAVIAWELPLEGFGALLLPGLGLISDIFIDGFEIVLLPITIACLVLSLRKVDF